MAKKTNSSINGTSFYDVTIKASVNQLINAFGEPDYDGNTGDDKVNFEWEMETEDGEVFTIYDWKEYRMIDVNEKIEWHIGANSKMISWDAKDEITRELSN
jgi:hypothetical protein